MAASLSRTLVFEHPDDTARFAADLGQRLGPGDVLLLEGDVGAGKTHFARALIRALQEHPEDVPSPTFTLVQTYDTRRGEVWHADLYRLSGAQEIEELGLAEAFTTAICLVEWPDRLGPLTPAAALMLQFRQGSAEDARNVTATWDDSRWTALLEAVPA